MLPNDGETVTISINGVAQNATITGGAFSAVFDTQSLPTVALPYAITYTYNGNGALSDASDSSTTLTVNPQTVTITADDQTVVFGNAIPSLTYTISQTVALDVPPVCVSSRDSSAAGSYPGAITCSGAASSGYVFLYVAGKLTVSPVAPTLAVTGGVYTYDGAAHPAIAVATGIGGAVVAGQTSFTYSMLAPGDTVAPFNVGAYAASANFVSSDPNYTSASGTAASTLRRP